MTKRKVTLFWIPHFEPTAHELAFGDAIQGDVRYRNAHLHRPGDRIEECDQVTGCYPDGYKDKPGITILEYDPGAETSEEEDEVRPRTKKDFEAALTEMDVEFPPGLKLAELGVLYDKAKADAKALE